MWGPALGMRFAHTTVEMPPVTNQGAPAWGPCVLPHPLDDVVPLRLEAPGRPLGRSAMTTAASEHERVLWSSPDVPMLMTYNSVCCTGLVHILAAAHRLTQHLERVALWHAMAAAADAVPDPSTTALATPATRPLLRGVSSVLTGGSAGPPSTAARCAVFYSAAFYSAMQPVVQLPVACHSSIFHALPPHLRSALRRPDGTLSPAAFSPLPRAASAQKALINGGALLLPVAGTLGPCRRLWERSLPTRTHAFGSTPTLHATQVVYVSPYGAATGAAPTSATLVHDVEGRALLAMLSRQAQRLLLLTLPAMPAGQAPVAVDTVLDMEAVAVAAVSATRSGDTQGLLDLLVLRPNGSLSLFWGAHCMVNVTVNAGLTSTQATPCTSSMPRPASWCASQWSLYLH